MLPLLNSKQIKIVDAATIRLEQISSFDLMERASLALSAFISKKWSTPSVFTVHIFCGNGNNGGDGLALARLLIYRGYRVIVYVSKEKNSFLKTSLQNWLKLKEIDGIKIKGWEEAFHTQITSSCLIIDALFGAGLNRPLGGRVKKLVFFLNQQKATRISIDMPSGLAIDSHSKNCIFCAEYTLSFQTPKLSFFFPQNSLFVGEWMLLDIGLNATVINAQKTNFYLLTQDDIVQRLKKRNRFGHKGTYGHVCICGGSEGKAGAVILSARAALHSGCGLVTCYTPSSLRAIIQSAFPQAMCIADESKTVLENFKPSFSFNAIAIGMGMGTALKTVRVLEKLFASSKSPLVLDADSLNIMSYNKKLLSKIPPDSILTPHPKEFERLFGKYDNDFERLKLLQKNAKKLNVIIVLKDAYTAIALPNGKIFFNRLGNPGMATAGSGDVLSGIIASFIAQGYSPENAAVLGVYIHAWAGDIAAEQYSQSYITAQEIIEALAKVFKILEH